jgi:hypothetical protein
VTTTKTVTQGDAQAAAAAALDAAAMAEEEYRT